MSHLYELVGKWQFIAEMAFEQADDGELPPDLLAELYRIDEEIDVKLENCCKLSRHIAALAEDHAVEAGRQLARAKAGDAANERLKDYVRQQLLARGWQKRHCGLFDVGIQKSPPRVVINDLELVPHEFDKPVERQVSKSDIKDAIDAGRVVPGVSIEVGTHLRIR